MTTKTPTQLREEAARHDRDAHESFERCDTDGFLSQWASGLSAQKARAEADLIEAGGTAEFIALFDLDGNLLPAKLLPTQYGSSWAVFEDWGSVTEYGAPVLRWIGAFPKRENTLAKKGVAEGYVRARARVDYTGKGRGLSGAASVRVTKVRTQYDGLEEVVTTNRFREEES